MKRLKGLLFLSILVFFACEKESTNDENALESLENEAVVSAESIEDIESALDNIAFYSDPFFGAGNLAFKNSGPKKLGRSGFFNDCVDIVTEETDDTVTQTITFTGTCEDRDGNLISGTITKVETISDDDGERTVTIDDLSINGYVINGTQSYSYTSSNTNGNPEITSTTDISVVTEDGTATNIGTRTIEITAGGDTDTWRDDEKTITGTSTYTNEDGEIFVSGITTALVKPADCKYIASGIKTYTNAGETTTLNYGDGTCDKIITKTDPDGTVTEVTLRKRRRH